MPPPVAKVSELPIWVAVPALSKNVAALLLIVVIPAYWEFIKLFNVFIFPCKEVSQNISNKEYTGLVSATLKKGCIVIMPPDPVPFSALVSAPTPPGTIGTVVAKATLPLAVVSILIAKGFKSEL